MFEDVIIGMGIVLFFVYFVSVSDGSLPSREKLLRVVGDE